MQDLTTGSLTRHLLKTTGFMLVTMVFQTLYFLIDLYWVGRLGNGSGRRRRHCRQPHVHRPRNHADARRRRDHTRVARGGTARITSVRCSCSTSRRCCRSLSGSCSSSSACRCASRTSSALGADARTAALASDYLLWFIPAMALQFAMVAMGAALRGTGNFKPGMIVSTATVILNMILAPFLIFGWVTASPVRRRGCSHFHVRGRRHRVGLADALLPAERMRT